MCLILGKVQMKRTLMIKAFVPSALGTMPLQVLAAEHTIITGTEFATVLAATTHTASLTSTGITAVEGNIISNNTVTANGTLHGGGMLGVTSRAIKTHLVPSTSYFTANANLESWNNNIFSGNSITINSFIAGGGIVGGAAYSQYNSGGGTVYAPYGNAYVTIGDSSNNIFLNNSVTNH